MAKKADFSEQEWDALHKGVTGAGLLVSLSDRSFFDTFKEAGALGKHVAKAKQTGSSELVRELADVHGTGFGVTTSPDVVERETLEALHTAKTTLESKAPDELEPYRQFVLEVAQSVSDAAGGGVGSRTVEVESRPRLGSLTRFSFVIARRQALLDSEGSARSLGLDLLEQLRGFEKNGQFRFTPPTHTILAFEQALHHAFEKGMAWTFRTCKTLTPCGRGKPVWIGESGAPLRRAGKDARPYVSKTT